MKKFTFLAILMAIGIVFWSCSDDGDGTSEPENNKPTLSVISPLPYTGYDLGQIIQVRTTAEDNDGTIQEVRFIIDGVGLTSATAFPFNADLTTDTLSYGCHVLKIIAIDNDGAKNEKDIPFGIIPPKPGNLQILQNNIYTFTISWAATSGSEGYNIQRKIDDGTFIDLGSTTSTSYIDSTVSKKGFSMVYYQVAAYNDIYVSEYTQQNYSINFPNPFNLSYTKVDLATIKLDWDQNSEGEDGFKIDKKIGDGEYIIGYGGVSTNVETWSDTNAEINETLRYRVYGFKGDNTSSSVETPLINNTFPPPTNLQVNHTSVTTATLTWNDNSTGEDTFEIERKLNTETNFIKIAEVSGSSISSKTYDDSSIEPGNTYDYRVKAVKGSSSSDYMTVTGYISFPAPSNLYLIQNEIYDITLNWTDNSIGENGFKIDRKYNDNPWSENYASVSSNIFTWNETLLDSGIYYYRVRAFYSTFYSDYTNEVSVIPNETITFQKTFGGTLSDQGLSVKMTTEDGYIIVGNTYSFGAGGRDAWLIKTDLNGEKIWDKTYGGVEDDTGSSVLQSADSEYMFCGSFKNGSSGSTRDAFIVKTGTNGTSNWEKIIDGLYDDISYSILQTTDGGYIFTGYTYYETKLNTQLWLVKISDVGDVTWQKSFDNFGNHDYGYSIDYANDGGYIITGRSIDTNNLDKLWLIKTDSDGNEIWNKTFGGTGNEVGNSVVKTNDGGFLITGRTSSFGAGGYDVWLIKTDSDGNEIWNKTFGGISDDIGNSVIQTRDGGFLIAGSTSSYGAGSYDAWLIKTDINGNEIWNKTFGGISVDTGNSVIQSSDGGYVVTGITSSFGNGDNDVWLIKTDNQGNINKN